MDKIIENLLLELKRGTLVLSVLLNCKEAQYGYSLVTQLQEAGVDIEQNTLYPLLRRLEKQGLLQSKWDVEARPRKYYFISDEGKEVLSILITEWKKINSTLDNMIKEGDL